MHVQQTACICRRHMCSPDAHMQGAGCRSRNSSLLSGHPRGDAPISDDSSAAACCCLPFGDPDTTHEGAMPCPSHDVLGEDGAVACSAGWVQCRKASHSAACRLSWQSEDQTQKAAHAPTLPPTERHRKTGTKHRCNQDADRNIHP
jgi:hypothetical protein